MVMTSVRSMLQRSCVDLFVSGRPWDMGWGCCLRYLPCALHGTRHLDHGSAIHGSTALRRHSSNTPTPCLNQLLAWWLPVDRMALLSAKQPRLTLPRVQIKGP